jgi:hypothetical protein
MKLTPSNVARLRISLHASEGDANASRGTVRVASRVALEAVPGMSG